ncbi:Peptidoglycan/LPS O-acetylase OafA/YrhL, contains acyltransferase and SGNH-hydrolase domains [Lachnospiraceae bacterium G41]|nr:Peptidoglycan/LPS O-acetylase OafA/YrhL, contains acyltransferase and SGNH-hydrolase domains [Lachnospiraceae bacterium G41]
MEKTKEVSNTVQGEKGNRAEQLQFLRFICFLMICLLHSSKYCENWVPVGYGAANAVVFFFILSGFTSGYSSYDGKITLSFKNEILFLYGKVKKFYPLYFLTTMYFVIYSGIPNYVTILEFKRISLLLVQLAKNLLLIQSWFSDYYFAFNGVGWFLSTIFFLYFFNLPLKKLFCLIKEKTKNIYIYMLIAIVSFVGVYCYCYFTRNTNIQYMHYAFPISRLFEYIAGMSLGYFIRSISKKITYNNFLFYSILELLMFTFWIYNIFLPMKDWKYNIIHWFIPNCLLICVFALGKGLLSDIFKLKFFLFLGNISFECFLLHKVIIKMYYDSGVEKTGIFGNIFSLLFIIIGTVLLASLIKNKKSNR